MLRQVGHLLRRGRTDAQASRTFAQAGEDRCPGREAKGGIMKNERDIPRVDFKYEQKNIFITKKDDTMKKKEI
jgi:hypothetical protein